MLATASGCSRSRQKGRIYSESEEKPNSDHHAECCGQTGHDRSHQTVAQDLLKPERARTRHDSVGHNESYCEREQQAEARCSTGRVRRGNEQQYLRGCFGTDAVEQPNPKGRARCNSEMGHEGRWQCAGVCERDGLRFLPDGFTNLLDDRCSVAVSVHRTLMIMQVGMLNDDRGFRPTPSHLDALDGLN